jgi:hypothetical protein
MLAVPVVGARRSRAGGVQQSVGHVTNVGACAGVTGGWYYDDPLVPTKVLVCAQTCSAIQAVADVRVSFVFGCATKEAI